MATGPVPTRPLEAGTGRPPVEVRKARPEDADSCGRICYKAFRSINLRHGFPPDFPEAEVAVGVLAMMFSHPGFYAVVAELGGRIMGSNCLDERGSIAGVGPITVDPEVQNQGVGRKLMQAVLERAGQQGFAGIRLLQAAFHNRSLSLYAKLGFDVREPMSVMQGPPIQKPIEGYRVRAARESDVAAANDLCARIHGHHRGGELRDAVRHGTAVVAERVGRITAYATAIGFFGHAVGESNADIQALLATAPSFLGPGVIVPTRNAALFRWCLENGLHVVEPMTLMTVGLYNEPQGAYLPSVLF